MKRNIFNFCFGNKSKKKKKKRLYEKITSFLKNIKNNYLNIVQLFNIDNGPFKDGLREIDKIKIQVINILNHIRADAAKFLELLSKI